MVDFGAQLAKREVVSAHQILDRYSVPKTRHMRDPRHPEREIEITLTLSARIELLTSFNNIRPTVGL